MNPRWWWAIGSALLIGVLGLVWWLLAGSALGPQPSGATSVTEAEEVAAALELIESDPESLLPDALADALDGDIANALPEGTTINAEPDTWTPSDAEGGVIQASLDYPDGTSQMLAIVMVKENGDWKVLQTITVEEVSQ